MVQAWPLLLTERAKISLERDIDKMMRPIATWKDAASFLLRVD